ncbi:oligomeric, coiled-coil, peripheral membrane protein [Agyrium rufum]|nr:oligomeric, coiled-coil, peripheral membrane protein [Agyrium rufum]
MSLTIYISSSGKSLKTNASEFTAVNELQSWIAQRASIDAQDQVLMTARGKQVKIQSLFLEVYAPQAASSSWRSRLIKRATQGEIFVYDRASFSPSSRVGARRSSAFAVPASPFTTKSLPSHPVQRDDLKQWQNLLKQQRGWAIDVSVDCERAWQELRNIVQESGVVQRATAIAVESVKQHVDALEQKYGEARTWASEFINANAGLLADTETVIGKLSSIQCESMLLDLVRVPDVLLGSKSSEGPISLQQILDEDRLIQMKTSAYDAITRLSNDLAVLVEKTDEVIGESVNLLENFHHEFTRPTDEHVNMGQRLMEEVEVMVKKVGANYEAYLSAPDTPKSVTSVSRTAQLNTRDFMPALQEIGQELYQLLQKANEHKDETGGVAQAHLQKISHIQSGLVEIQPRLKVIDISPEESAALDAVAFAIGLPSVYGSLLVEAFQRGEWGSRILTDASVVAEELARSKGEEERRRKKWLKSMDDYLTSVAMNSKALAVEVNTQPPDVVWPRVSRSDVENYITSLKELGGFNDVLRELDRSLLVTSMPSKKQMRRSKMFKNGNLAESGLLSNSQVFGANDEVFKSLQSDKLKLEDKLKGSESRVRKLEDLLHRQSQMPPPGNAPGFGSTTGPILERHATSPTLHHAAGSPKMQDNLSRRSSVSSRRFSANQNNDEKQLVQRILKLEAELNAEKAKSHDLHSTAMNRVAVENEWEHRLEEALSTKRDLMENFEAQQIEFDNERRLNNEDTGKLRIRLEELEDELDRLLGSRDMEKVHIDRRVQKLQDELLDVRATADKRTLSLEEQLGSVHDLLQAEQSKNGDLHRQLQGMESERIMLQEQVRKMANEREQLASSRDAQIRTLRSAHTQLAEGQPAPEHFTTLVDAIDILAERSTSHLRDIKKALEIARSENASLEKESRERKEKIAGLADDLVNEKRSTKHLQEELDVQRARYSALQTQLDDEKQELGRLRSNIAVGDTDAQQLRLRVSEEENKVEKMSTQLASTSKLVDNLEKELSKKSSQMQSLQSKFNTSTSASGERARHAQDVSTYIFTLIDRLVRLINHIGFSITKEGDGMVFQRMPRSAIAALQGDGSQSMMRSLSQPLNSFPSSEQIIPDHVRWASCETVASENESFRAFHDHISAFSSDRFSEAIIKRIKESEHLARKWQREAKIYREKAHRQHSEAHDKIAFRAFKEGDLALFLPTRNQATRSWAAFNVGAPHYFLREQENHRLRTRDWLLARISRIEERIVDLSKSMTGDRQSIGEVSDGGTSVDEDNPFELSDGLHWYLLDAAEEKTGAPIAPGAGKSTVASANVDAKGSIEGSKSAPTENAVTKTLTRSLDSRRSSSNSKRSFNGAVSSSIPKASTSERDSTNIGISEVTSALDRPSTASNERHVEPSAAAKAAAAAVAPPPNDDALSSTRALSPLKHWMTSIPPLVPLATSHSQQEHSPIRASPNRFQEQAEPDERFPAAGLPSTSSPMPRAFSPKKASVKEKEKEKPRSKGWSAFWSLDYSLESGQGD